MKIVGLYNWHDGGYCVLEDGFSSTSSGLSMDAWEKECNE